ncbi:hypothetical protein G6F22_021702 [Rhizopus arrhizus]|nr:hypothetical protein G6F22_021702 [Rhizopus arrhizus]
MLAFDELLPLLQFHKPTGCQLMQCIRLGNVPIDQQDEHSSGPANVPARKPAQAPDHATDVPQQDAHSTDPESAPSRQRARSADHTHASILHG